MKSVNMADVVTIEGHQYYCAEIGNRRGKEVIDFEILKPVDGVAPLIEISYKKGLLDSPIGDTVVFNETTGWKMK